MLKNSPMDQKFGFSRVLTILLLCFSIHSANGQIQPIQGCSLQGVELQDCIAESANSAASESCCKAINLAAQAGAYCLCLMLRSSTPLLGLALSFQLSDCAISIPPVTQCQNELPVFHAPDPSSFGKPPLEHSTSDDFAMPMPEEKDEISQNSTRPGKSSVEDTHLHSEFGNMRSHGGEKFQSILKAGLLVFVALCAIM